MNPGSSTVGDGSPNGDAYRVAVRPDYTGMTDDVVVNDVAMFRAEMMNRNDLWMSCYLDANADQRVTFLIRSTRKGLRIWLTEVPDVPCESDDDITTCFEWAPC